MADALSRKSVGAVELGAIVTISTIDWDALTVEMQNDTWLQQVKTEVESKTKTHLGFSVQDGRLLYKGRIVIPQGSRVKATILNEYHNSPVGGHSGDVKTYLRIASDWYWAGMRKDVATHV